MKKHLNSLLFWTLIAIASILIFWKFFASPEDPMENKILFVFITFLFCAIAFRWIHKKAREGWLRRWSREAMEWSDTGVSAVLLAFLIMSFVVQAFKIPSGSMQPTLHIGDHLFVNKFIYGTHLPFSLHRLWTLKKIKRFDVVVFLCPPKALSQEERDRNIKKDFIKRAIGLPGETLELRDKILYINGKAIPDPFGYKTSAMSYLKPELWDSQQDYQQEWEQGEFVYRPIEVNRDNFGPVQIPEGHYFVMGDNRDGSFDSRFWGPLPQKYVKGKAWLVYWPLNRLQTIH